MWYSSPRAEITVCMLVRWDLISIAPSIWIGLESGVSRAGQPAEQWIGHPTRAGLELLLLSTIRISIVAFLGLLGYIRHLSSSSEAHYQELGTRER